MLTAAIPVSTVRFQLFSDKRHLLYPLAISLALHALLLWQNADSSPAPASATASNRHLQAKMHAKPSTSPTVAAPMARQTPAEIPAPVREVAAPNDPPAPPPTEQPATEPPSSEAPAQTAAETPPIQPLRPGIDLAGLREYHMALGRMAKRFRHYPPAAREAGAQGRVAIRLIVAQTGVTASLGLLASSGFPELDQAALEMMHLAAGHTQVPDSLRGRAFNIDLAIDFNPEDAP